MDMIYASAADQARAVAGGVVSSRDLLEAVLARVEARDAPVNAVVVRRTDVARALADAADAAVRNGADLGPLHGVPITVKECYALAGMPTTAGAPEMATHVAEADSVVVERLAGAGAVIYGKTNTPYMADDLQTYNDVYGTTNNPWDPDRTPGGSSGGSAAAVAAGFSPLEMGSDIGGSIRNPAAMCGIYGHKPSWGIVPLRGHIPGPPDQRSVADLAVGGPLSFTPDDLELALDVVAGPDQLDATGWRLSLPAPRHHRLRDFRIGVLLDSEHAPVSSDVADVVSDAVDALARAGVEIVDHLPRFDMGASHRHYLQLLYGQQAGNFSRSMRVRYDREFESLDDSDHTRHAMLVRGVSQRHRHWLAVNERRHRIRAAWSAWFETADLLLCPVTTVAAFPHDHSPLGSRTLEFDGAVHDYWDPMFWAGLATLPLLPATALPAGLSRSGLPVGMQAIGPYLEDRTPIQFARCASGVLGAAQPPPGF